MIVGYTEEFQADWDEFVLHRSINGNFLQTRRFLNYHPPGRFTDASFLILDNNTIAAVVPANTVEEGTVLLSHQGSTYGGIIVGKDYANSMGYEFVFGELISFFKERRYKRVELSMHHWLYSPDDKYHDLCEYFFHLYEFDVRAEIGFYIDLRTLSTDYTTHFEKLKRRKLAKAEKQGLWFKKLDNDAEVEQFHQVLSDNMKKFQTKPLHSLEEILDFKNDRLKEETSFYGVFLGNTMIAGSMVWNFCEKKVFHTQYLASLQEYLNCCPNEFLYTKLIQAALEEGYHYISYGTASLNHGMTYNKSLGMFKEGFNTDSYMNRCYIWENKD